MIYLDNAATTLIKPATVAKAMVRALKTCAGPSRGGHAAAVRADETLFSCRKAAGELFKLTPERVVFTINATHALNIAIISLVHPGSRVVVSGYEHNAVMRPLNGIKGVLIETVSARPFSEEAILAGFREKITPNVGCVICTQVSNVFGFTLPVEQIGAICRKQGVPFIIDASQAAGSHDIDVSVLKADLIAMPGHKGLYGPQGSGLLLVCGDIMPEPLMRGGTGSNSRSYVQPDFLPDRLESGTPAVPAIAGLNAGIEHVRKHTPASIGSHAAALVTRAVSAMMDDRRLELHLPKDPAGMTLFSFSAKNIDSETLAVGLAERGIALRAGLHCAPLAHESEGTITGGTLRVSPSFFTTERDIDAFLDALTRELKKT